MSEIAARMRAQSLPRNGKIALWRDVDGVHTNVPHLCIEHSPTGFEYGYGGSGPADLALNIVEWVLTATGYSGGRVKVFEGICFSLAYQMHQSFKWHFIASLPPQGGIIPWNTATAWVSAWREKKA